MYLESFILQDSFDGSISAGVDEFDLKHNTEGSISDDFDALVADFLFFLSLAILDALGDDSLRVQISYALY